MTVKAIFFDAYGTLFDVHSVSEKCEQFFPEKGMQISEVWRQKQLEYTWLRSLMDRYEDFWKVTGDSLIFALKALDLQASQEIRSALLNEYLRLKAYPEVREALELLSNRKLAILSNGTLQMLNPLVRNANLTEAFNDVISVDELKIYKPYMGVYELGTAKLSIDKTEALFVTSNPWDASGAKTFGFQVCWINRNNKPFDELGVKPDLIVRDLEELANILQ
ncbi:2-haloacid dehalogenase [Cytobacillus oceanisediminis]|uniref:2-haloacid dehalogenase n=1 Tax=Cytobacillus oceanisediminis TaxID=665099 RepID=A0A2V2ZWE7_9BACI|nr:haloacid dehalogenase type II [Cytobacillus oceanisediminis]PWW28385.1 2-haloacid dehalogenase [Cytobacillus oceanisediminis]